MLGSIYWCGVLTTIIIVPWLADKYGRKFIVIFNYFTFELCVVGIMLSHDINMLYTLLFFCGVTYAGRIVVCINYMIEFNLEKNK